MCDSKSRESRTQSLAAEEKDTAASASLASETATWQLIRCTVRNAKAGEEASDRSLCLNQLLHFHVTDAVVLLTMRVRITLLRKERLLNARASHGNGIGNTVRMLRADGFGQDKRILACATMRGRKMPKALALTIRTRVLNKGLKEGFSPIISYCSNNEHFRERTNTLYHVTLHPHFLIQQPQWRRRFSLFLATYFFRVIYQPLFLEVSTPLFRSINSRFSHLQHPHSNNSSPAPSLCR